MADIRIAKLELLRSGPQHNQLLSPLTPYIALCGPGAPQIVHLPYEHRQLLTRLARLRYEQNGASISPEQRESELRELGEAVGRVLGEISGLQTALSGTAHESSTLVHIRLALSALELGMVPFEAAIAPDNFPGSGAPLLLRTPTVMTREVRRTQPIEVRWSRTPRILFAFATPPGLRAVPAQAHLNALRRAIEPYVSIKDTAEARLDSVRKQLTVLSEASLKAIADACRTADYTHVHILAHGQRFEEAGAHRYGIALRNEGDGTADVVDGERLAIALRGAGLNGELKDAPTLVSLATCDSGTVDSVLAPGGSIAHALHEAGIPWVIASQFPLWMSASTIAVEALYGGVLSGADPRFVLMELRQRLRTEVPQTHDWASIVAYATSPWDFEAQIQAFFHKQVRSRLDVRFARLDELAVAQPSAAADKEIEEHGRAVRAEHAAWIERTKRRRAKDPAGHAEALGMSAASEKRLAIASAARAARAAQDGKPKDEKAWTDQAKKAYETARDHYRQAVQAQPTNHWVMTQFLSIVATPMMMPDDVAWADVRKRYAAWWSAARQVAEWQLQGAEMNLDRAWALGTLAELELLGSVYAGKSFREATACDGVARQCREIVACVGLRDFAVLSTRRQMQRYVDAWKHPRWEAIALAAVAALSSEP